MAIPCNSTTALFLLTRMFSFVSIYFLLMMTLLSDTCSVLGGGMFINSSLKSGQDWLTPSHYS